MDERVTEEYFFSLLDEAAASISGDRLREYTSVYDYEIKPHEEVADDISSCHRCEGCFSRTVYAEPLLSPNPLLLFVLPSPEGVTMLSSASFDYFTKWIKAIGLELRNVALTSLIRCPVRNFSSEIADICKDYLREEMRSLKPEAIVLLGKDTASYMLRRPGSFDSIRLHTYKVNGIKTFSTYAPSDLVRDRNLRVPIWEDLKFIRDNMSGENKA